MSNQNVYWTNVNRPGGLSSRLLQQGTEARTQFVLNSAKKKKKVFKRWGQRKVGGIINHLYLLTGLSCRKSDFLGFY